MNAEQSTDAVDVAILGGGAAGLTLALQLSQERPGTSIVILEKLTHPVPETTHKVGESTVEIAGHYLRDILGLGAHLRQEQLSKYGLRIFFSDGDNSDITRRVELGHSSFPPAAVGTYQIDRGRLENALATEVIGHGVEVRSGVQVRTVELRGDQDTHLVNYVAADGSEATLPARWVVDASGRAGLLRRHLGLTQRSAHRADAVWFRVGHPIDIADWSDDPDWHGRIVEGRRELSTNHLMGPGYWVWLIRLASDAISIGIVTDPEHHPLAGHNRFERALAWLQQHEPQCAAAVEAHRDELLDFRVMTDYSYDTEQVFSPDRWCLTGEAGLFLDPLYSPGLDLVAISNGLVTDLVVRGLAGEDVTERAQVHNQVFLLITGGWLSVYRDHAGTMGNARAMLAKVIWDTAVYWAIIGQLYFRDALKDLIDQPEIVISLARFSVMSEHVQAFFRDWAALDSSRYRDDFVRFYDLEFMRSLHSGMTETLDDAELAERFDRNVRLIEQLSGQMIDLVLTELGGSDDPETAETCRRWRDNDVLAGLVEIHRTDATENPLSERWLTVSTADLAGTEG